jgi:hypothetical protein
MEKNFERRVPSFRVWMLGMDFRVGWPGVALGVVG